MIFPFPHVIVSRRHVGGNDFDENNEAPAEIRPA
jgi:hypothetical protein